MRALALVLLLSGCYCMPEEGESVGDKAYFKGCWAEASKQKGNAGYNSGVGPRAD